MRMRTFIKIFVWVLIFSFAIGCHHNGNQAAILEWNKGSVQEEASGTAMWCALMRALSAAETRQTLKSGDYLAQIFLPDNQRSLLKTPSQREWAIKKQPPGMYAYIIARTLYFDHIVEQALQKHIPQIVILGTGYDSRPYRFLKLANETRFFELDTLPTLQHKKELLLKANVAIPQNVVFVPIDFTRDTFEEVFPKAGYDRHKKTLFLWEGVVPYLDAKAIDTTLRFIKANAPVGSTVCFDYTSPWSGVDLDELARLQEFGDFWKRNFPREPGEWTIEPSAISAFLSGRGYRVVDHLEAKRDDIQKKYFTVRDSVAIGRVPAIFGIVLASVAP
jgi:methyltransferase (TIGR00027 family)